jgi:hypothetical protein
MTISRKRQTDLKIAKRASKSTKQATVTQKQSCKTVSIKKSARKTSVERKKALKKYIIKRKDEKATSEDNYNHLIYFVTKIIIK